MAIPSFHVPVRDDPPDDHHLANPGACRGCAELAIAGELPARPAFIRHAVAYSSWTEPQPVAVPIVPDRVRETVPA
jgi:hypothetical protein